MFVLIGEGSDCYQEKVGGQFIDHDFEDQLALFPSEKSAKKFAEGFRLKSARHGSFGDYAIFRKSSILARYSSYRIEEYDAKVLPVFGDDDEFNENDSDIVKQLIRQGR